MARFGISARFPLGVFQGHRNGRGEPLPSTSRIHAALVCAAAKGSQAVERQGDLRPAATSVKAIEWFEAHPPDGIAIPPSRAVRGSGRVVSYRAEGVMAGTSGALHPRVVAKAISDGVAVGGAYGWVWDDVPDDIAQQLVRLCEDVPVLGEADSPVILEASVIEPTIVKSAVVSELHPSGLAVPTPVPGRLSALEEAYEAAYPHRSPSAAKDAFSQAQLPAPSPATSEGVSDVYYTDPSRPKPALPWREALVFPSSLRVDEFDRVKWCVAFHRMMAARASTELPGAITGRYPEGSRRPANRVAVQYVDGARPDLWGDQPGAFVLLLPEGMTDNDKGVLFAALSGNIAVYVDQQRVRTRLTLHVAADEFWPNPRPGLVRLWRPVPAAVAESRRQPRRSTGERWTLRDAAYLALGYVFRDRLEANPRDYHQVVDRARTSGMNVIEAHLIADSRTARYVHKVPENLVTQPFSATIDLGDMVSARTVLAIGQSRHLGGGLLVPVDVPPEQVGARRG